MLKTYKYRIYPTRKQASTLTQQLDECRWLYNHLLEQRKSAWETEKRALTRYGQILGIPKLKKDRPSLSSVHSQVLQNVAVRVDLAFKGFFRRVKAEKAEKAEGEKVGYPRFRGKDRYDSITFPQSSATGCYIKGDKLFVFRVGHIKIALHRRLDGVPKTATILRSATGKWYVCFSCEVEPVEPKRLASNEKAVGIDVGLHSFTTLSTGDAIESPKFFRKEERALAKVQRQLSKKEKGSKERRQKRKVVTRVHERIAFRRDNFAHQLSRRIVNSFGIIAVEDLEVKRMVHNLHSHGLAKSISDAAWSIFFCMLLYKAAEAGRVFIKVNPAYTTQDCNQCGHRQALQLSDRIYNCVRCGINIDRDLNAALNILRLGLQSLGLCTV